ncbi:hypothetical protein [Catenuloplanes atrovinosus]|uniref:Uncharacterized protein n=1 Tax=Catenuloplanes atrovinosus TaxID=137266 RepID=A0AAE3YLJ9_9ACTN|nr:hypothetical protein [Catenuloplanes atrovinosus]MDR7274419.1 hypothetical protein [Catenuloplanes atrovinosus]
MEDLIAMVVAPVVGFATRAAVKKGIAVLKARGVAVQPWVETIAPSIAGGLASLGAAAGSAPPVDYGR